MLLGTIEEVANAKRAEYRCGWGRSHGSGHAGSTICRRNSGVYRFWDLPMLDSFSLDHEWSTETGQVHSGSIIVTSVCHAVWNAGVYVLFGFGTTVGALGVKQTALYGQESGFWGLGLNLVLAVVIWQWWKRRHSSQIY
jgi:amino acid transporter